MSKRLYHSAAEKQRAYRERLRQSPPPAMPKPKPRRRTRPQRLLDLESATRELAEEYQDWLDAMPQSLSESNLAGELQEVIDQLQDIADELAAIEAPRIGKTRTV